MNNYVHGFFLYLNMKILKYLVIVIVVLAIIFFGAGILTPSVSYECSIEVDKPAKECWSVMNDESKMSKWILGYKRMEHVSGTPNTVGAVSNVFVDDNGEEMVMQETITTIQENEKMGMVFSMDFMEMDFEINFDEKDGKTTITTISTTEGNGMVAKSMMAFMSGMMKEQEMKNLSNLKKVIEENTTDYFPEPTEEAIETDSTMSDSTE